MELKVGEYYSNSIFEDNVRIIKISEITKSDYRGTIFAEYNKSEGWLKWNPKEIIQKNKTYFMSLDKYDVIWSIFNKNVTVVGTARK